MKQKLLLLLTTLFTASLSHAYTFEVDGIYYERFGENVSVTFYAPYYNSYSGDVVIPETVTYNGTTYSVTSIGDYAFYDCTGLTSVTIPNSVTSIDNAAFEGCSSLTSVTIPNSVTSIGNYAFYCCTGLTSVTIPNSVTSIGDEAFYVCSGLTSVTIPNSVTSIGDGAFSGCSGLTSFYGEYASDDHRCLIIEGRLNSFAPSGLTFYVIPNSVTSIGNYAFAFCSRLTSVTIPNSVTSIGVRAFYDCTGLTSVTIPNSVTSIGNSAFSFCDGLTSVTIPNSVTSIGNGAFSGCSGLTSFYGEYASDDHRCLIIEGRLNSFAPSGLTSYVIPNSVTSIGNYAFYCCTGLTSVTIPNSVTSIGDSAFHGCSGLTSVTIPNSVTSIGDSAFEGSGLTSVTVENENPANISLGYDVFFGVPLSSCTLYVPYGSEDLYSNAPVWKNFGRVEGFASGVDDVYMDEKTDPNAPYYDLTGRRVENPTPGIYIQNGKKVLVK